MTSGIWGSAFCILFKRLLEDNRNLDPAEMIRQEMGLHDDIGQQLEEEQENRDSSDMSSDSDDDDEDSGEGSAEETVGKGARVARKTSASFVPASVTNGSSHRDSDRDTSDGESSGTDLQPPMSFLRGQDSSESFDDVDTPHTPTPMEVAPTRVSGSSSPTREEGRLPSPESPRKGVRFCQRVEHFQQRSVKQQKQSRKVGSKPVLKRAATTRRGKSRSFWSSLLKGIFEK